MNFQSLAEQQFRNLITHALWFAFIGAFMCSCSMVYSLRKGRVKKPRRQRYNLKKTK